MEKIEPLTPSPNIVQASLDAYREAAAYDDYMFGNIDYRDSWLGISTSV